MKLLSVFTILLVTALYVEANLYEISLTTINFETTRPIQGQLSVLAKNDFSNIDIVFDETHFFKHKNLKAKLDLPGDEEIQEFVLKFKENGDEKNKFVVGPIVAVLLNKSEAQVFKPESRFISENNYVFYKKV